VSRHLLGAQREPLADPAAPQPRKTLAVGPAEPLGPGPAAAAVEDKGRLHDEEPDDGRDRELRGLADAEAPTGVHPAGGRAGADGRGRLQQEGRGGELEAAGDGDERVLAGEGRDVFVGPDPERLRPGHDLRERALLPGLRGGARRPGAAREAHRAQARAAGAARRLGAFAAALRGALQQVQAALSARRAQVPHRRPRLQGPDAAAPRRHPRRARLLPGPQVQRRRRPAARLLRHAARGLPPALRRSPGSKASRCANT
jgi:hypothetical protein